MIIGLGHQSRVGKDICGNFMASILRMQGHQSVEVTSFATGLKEITYRLFGHLGVKPGAYYEENPKERSVIIPELGYDVVQLWIDVGQKMRDIYPKVWLNLCIQGSNADILIIRDVRFPNELDAIEDEGGFTIKVTREGQEVRGSDTKIPASRPWGAYIANNGTLKELYARCEQVVKEVFDARRS